MRVMAMAGRKKEVGKGSENERPELKLEANDLMELEFGRLLGEPRQATLAKVLPFSNIQTMLDVFLHLSPACLYVRKFNLSQFLHLRRAGFEKLECDHQLFK